MTQAFEDRWVGQVLNVVQYQPARWGLGRQQGQPGFDGLGQIAGLGQFEREIEFTAQASQRFAEVDGEALRLVIAGIQAQPGRGLLQLGQTFGQQCALAVAGRCLDQ